MDSTNSFKGYGKVDELQEAAFRQKTRKRKIILSISIFLLIALIVGAVAGTIARNKNKNISADIPTSSALKAICSATEYPDSCYSTLKSSPSTKPGDVFKYSLTIAMNALQKLANLPDQYISRTDNPAVKEALTVCGAVLNDAVDSLNDTVSAGGKVTSMLDDVKTWLSTALTDQETCLDALEEVNADFGDEIRFIMKNSTEYVSNSLAIVAKIIGVVGDLKVPAHRRRLLGFPGWVSAGDRRILQESKTAPDVTVAADGSGDVTTINEAVEKIPKKSKRRFVIYVKAGVYVENVELDKSCWNVMIYGDGKNATVVSGSKNFVDGTPTFATATFAVVGKGFIARDIGFRNTAGPEKHQAVALRSGSDQSVFYRCSFDAFQDTLYPHSNRQFYRECVITGTIDFIFGNSAVVFQNCLIQPRQPLPNQFVTITAQGKKDPNQNTGIVIQRCTMSPLDSLTAKTYLGRPWKDYSTTVIMESDIGAFLDPKGWISWVYNVDPPNSIFYAEYRNTGPGANMGNRVNWAGFKPNLTAGQASKYNVNSFIQGPSWLPAANVNYDST